MGGEPDKNRLDAYFWVMLGTFMFAVMFIIPKHLGDSISPIQVTFFRYLSGFLTICPVYLYRRRNIRKQAHAITGYGFHLARAFFGATTTVSITYAVTHIPLANANAINMTSGMFAALFAVLFLGERLGWRGAAAILVSFTGAVIVAQPKFDAGGQWLSTGAVAALISAMAWGIDSVILKYAASRDDPSRLLVIVNGAASLILLGPALYFWRDVTATETGLLMLMGPIAIIGQYFNILGFRRGDAINVSVVRYTGIFFATLIGIAFFNEWPTVTTITGSLLIFAGAFAMLRFGARRG